MPAPCSRRTRPSALSTRARRTARRIRHNPRFRLAAALALALTAAAALAANISCSAVRTPASVPGPAASGAPGGSTRPGPAPRGTPAPVDTEIRVLLLENVATFDVSVTGPCKVTDGRGRPVKDFPQGIARTPVTAAREGIVLARLQFAVVDDHGTTQWLRPPAADESIPAAAARPMTWIEIIPARPGTLSIGSNRYKGRLRVVRDGSTLCAVNVLDIEDYLPGVLRGELPRNWRPEAFKAQAVASRTFALYEKGRRGADVLYDVRATVASQVYRGEDGNGSDLPAAAVEQTRGQVLTLDGSFVHAYFSSTCGGKTERPSLCWKAEPDTAALSGAECGFCRGSPTYRWGPVVWAKDKIMVKLRRKAPAEFGRSFGELASIAVAGRSATGRPAELLLTGSQGATVRVNAYDFRLWVSEGEARPAILPSSFFEIAESGSNLSFTGRGFGHGVGLCQYGAEGQAAAGANYQQILARYYPGSALVRLP